MSVTVQVIESIDQMQAAEELQRRVWTGDETEVVPVHLMAAAVHNGGLMIGAFDDAPDAGIPALVGFVFSFPGLYDTADGPRLKQCSHMLAVHPDFRKHGIGFLLKRAQWQMVRHQGIDRIVWTYDPLLSLNAHLNIDKLGAVCNTYLPNFYGEMRDGLNVGLPSDRFEVDWWVSSVRVNRRLSRRARPSLDLAHYYAGGVEVINRTHLGEDGWPRLDAPPNPDEIERTPMLLVEIPSDFQSLKASSPALALEWRLYTRQIFSGLFQQGYMVTDFVFLRGSQPRSFYVLSHGESTL